jgi:anti-sigma regulatory factor (Ser/Thr protein kinase)
MQTLPKKYIDILQQSRRFGVGSVSHYCVREPMEAVDLARSIAAEFKESQRIRLGLHELLLNAIEHGNLEIGFDLKSKLLYSGTYMDTLEFRLASQKYANRHVDLFVETFSDRVCFTVADQGPGFDPEPYMNASTAPSDELHGRGIILVRQACFDHLNYNDKGNVAVGISIFKD